MKDDRIKQRVVTRIKRYQLQVKQIAFCFQTRHTHALKYDGTKRKWKRNQLFTATATALKNPPHDNHEKLSG